jgi:DNA repair protein RecN (Recombination protein N)
LQSAQIELADITDEIERINDNTGLDPERLQAANDRLDAGYRLLKKHGVHTTNELLAIQKNLSEKLQQVLNIGDTIAEKETLSKQLFDEATNIAQKISANRKNAAPSFETKIAAILKQVGMPNARLKVEILPTSLQNHGADQIQFLFDGNKSGRFEPLRKVASGGELSRLMLGIKSIVAGSMQLPTLIFDEIDSGISGEAARQVGIIMKELASRHQVIAITHQPQVAAKATAHYFVYKREMNGSVQTQMKLLDENERIDIIANMLAGENPSATVLQNAREMMGIG